MGFGGTVNTDTYAQPLIIYLAIAKGTSWPRHRMHLSVVAAELCGHQRREVPLQLQVAANTESAKRCGLLNSSNGRVEGSLTRPLYLSAE